MRLPSRVLRRRTCNAFYVSSAFPTPFDTSLPGSLPKSLLPLLRPDQLDVLRRCPRPDVLALQGRGHQIGKLVRRAGEHRAAERGESGGMTGVVGGAAVIIEGQQGDDVDAGARQRPRPRQ